VYGVSVVPETIEGSSSALLRQPYPLFLVGSRAGDEMNLMTASWGTQCSFEPRLYSIFIEEDSHTRKLIDAGGAFTVCLLPSGIEDVVSQYTRPAETVGGKLGDHAYFEAEQTGCPVYDGSVAWFECRVTEARPTGDHIQYIGEVIGGDTPTLDPAWTVQDIGWEYGG